MRVLEISAGTFHSNKQLEGRHSTQISPLDAQHIVCGLCPVTQDYALHNPYCLVNSGCLAHDIKPLSTSFSQPEPCGDLQCSILSRDDAGTAPFYGNPGLRRWKSRTLSPCSPAHLCVPYCVFDCVFVGRLRAGAALAVSPVVCEIVGLSDCTERENSIGAARIVFYISHVHIPNVIVDNSQANEHMHHLLILVRGHLFRTVYNRSKWGFQPGNPPGRQLRPLPLTASD